MDEAYAPIPFSEEKLERVEWNHVLATLDVCTLNYGIQLCDEKGYDIVPIFTVGVMNESIKLNVPQVKPQCKCKHKRKHKQKHVKKYKEHRVATMTTLQVEDEEEFVEPFHISIQILTQCAHFEAFAFIDSRATCNNLSYDA